MGLLALAPISPKTQSIFQLAALVAYVFAAVSGLAVAGKRSNYAIGFIALGLFLWHFPGLWNLVDRAYS